MSYLVLKSQGKYLEGPAYYFGKTGLLFLILFSKIHVWNTSTQTGAADNSGHTRDNYSFLTNVSV